MRAVPAETLMNDPQMEREGEIEVVVERERVILRWIWVCFVVRRKKELLQAKGVEEGVTAGRKEIMGDQKTLWGAMLPLIETTSFRIPFLTLKNSHNTSSLFIKQSLSLLCQQPLLRHTISHLKNFKRKKSKRIIRSALPLN